MANLNRIILVGRLAGDPDSKFTVEGLPRVKFQLAVNRFQKEGMPPAVDMIDVVALGKLAEVFGEHLKKGNLVLVEGRIQVRSFEVAGGGRKWVTEVVAKNMQMIDAGKAEVKESLAAPSEDIPTLTEETLSGEEDLPF